MRRKLKQFPEVVKLDIQLKKERAVMQAKPSFDQYVALLHALEEAGGAAQMFHPAYRVPQAHYAVLGVRDKTDEKLESLDQQLRRVRGVRSVVIDPDRWFFNEQGIQVGASVIFADTNPRLELDLVEAARSTGFIYEAKNHGAGADDHDEWSEMNHAFSGLCLLFLAGFGMLQAGLARPPAAIRYGTVAVWLAMFTFLFIRSDRSAWPLGPLSWWESFRDPEIAQHRMGIGVLLLIATGDYLRLRNQWKVAPAVSRWGTLIVGLAGSAMLFAHLHKTIDPAHYRQVTRMNLQHLGMASAALGFTLSKFAWDTWRVPHAWGKYLWLGFMGGLGLLLTLYVE